MKYIWLALATLLTPVILLVAAAWLLYTAWPAHCCAGAAWGLRGPAQPDGGPV